MGILVRFRGQPDGVDAEPVHGQAGESVHARAPRGREFLRGRAGEYCEGFGVLEIED